MQPAYRQESRELAVFQIVLDHADATRIWAGIERWYEIDQDGNEVDATRIWAEIKRGKVLFDSVRDCRSYRRRVIAYLSRD